VQVNNVYSRAPMNLELIESTGTLTAKKKPLSSPPYRVTRRKSARRQKQQSRALRAAADVN
jgi:hypothetical protein